MLEDFFNAVWAGQRSLVETMLTNRYRPEQILEEAAASGPGKRIEELGAVRTRKIGGGRRLVVVEAARVTTPAGAVVLREQFIVVRRGGQPRIDAFGADAAEEVTP